MRASLWIHRKNRKPFVSVSSEKHLFPDITILWDPGLPLSLLGKQEHGMVGFHSFLLFPQEQQPSWTDDLPLCHLSGVGSASNRTYSADGKGTESHPPEDNWLKFRYVWHCWTGQRKSVHEQEKILS